MKRVALLIILSCLLLLSGPSRAQDDDTAAEQQSDVLEYLDSTIDWYRSIQAMRLGPDSAQEAVILESVQKDAVKVLGDGFDYAFAEANILAPEEAADAVATNGSPSRLAAFQKNVADNLAAVQKGLADVNSQLAHARAAQRTQLLQQKQTLQGALSLAQAQSDLLGQIKGYLGNQKLTDNSFTGSIKTLKQAFPELSGGESAAAPAAAATGAVAKTISIPGMVATLPVPNSTAAARESSGIIAAISDFFPLWHRRSEIDALVAQVNDLEKSNDALRADLRTDLIGAVAKGRTMAAAAGVNLPPPPDAGDGKADKDADKDADKVVDKPVIKDVGQAADKLVAKAKAKPKDKAGDKVADKPAVTTPSTVPTPATPEDFDQLTARFRLLSTTVVPLGQQHVALETVKTELMEWRTVLTHEFTSSFCRLIIRLVLLAIVVIVPLILSEISRRASERYIKDPRRRRQLRTVRRGVVGTVIAVVVFMSLFAEVGSLATYVGLLTAGIAVALQQVILSMFAYFFFFGRFGVRVGERVTIVGTTGEVIEVGLLRVYLMEINAGKATGRIAVFPNLVFFQPAAFFKQIADTNYSWREISLTFAADTDQKHLQDKLLGIANTIYANYHDGMKRQQAALESATHLTIDIPRPDVSIQMADKGLVVTLRYPVDAGREDEIDKQMNEAVLKAVQADATLKLVATDDAHA